jgi:hypothetical protein
MFSTKTISDWCQLLKAVVLCCWDGKYGMVIDPPIAPGLLLHRIPELAPQQQSSSSLKMAKIMQLL